MQGFNCFNIISCNLFYYFITLFNWILICWILFKWRLFKNLNLGNSCYASKKFVSQSDALSLSKCYQVHKVKKWLNKSIWSINNQRYMLQSSIFYDKKWITFCYYSGSHYFSQRRNARKVLSTQSFKKIINDFFLCVLTDYLQFF